MGDLRIDFAEPSKAVNISLAFFCRIVAKDSLPSRKMEKSVTLRVIFFLFIKIIIVILNIWFRLDNSFLVSFFFNVIYSKE